jgi:hypothetical protein
MKENKISILSIDKFSDDSYLQLDNAIKESLF